jgi:hypothetical protein
VEVILNISKTIVDQYMELLSIQKIIFDYGVKTTLYNKLLDYMLNSMNDNDVEDCKYKFVINGWIYSNTEPGLIYTKINDSPLSWDEEDEIFTIS